MRTSDPAAAFEAGAAHAGPTVLLVVSHLGGWPTEAAILRPYLDADEDTAFVILDASVPGGSVRGRVPYALRVRFRGMRLGNRLRDRRLAASIPMLMRPGVFDHVHCMAHLMAVPFLDHLGDDHTLSVTVDAPLGRTFEEVLDWPGCGIGVGGAIALERRVFRRCSHILATSQWAARDAVDVGGSAAIEVVPCTAHDPGPLPPEGPETAAIAFIGDELRRKGGDRLLRWHARHFPAAEVHVFSAMPEPRRPHPNVRWHGRVPNDVLVREILPRMTMLALPTHEDFSPHVCIEAAACGLPVVSSELAGIPEIVSHGETGLLVQRDDDAGFVAAIRRLLDDPGAARRMGKAARARFEAELHPDVTAGRTAKVLAGLSVPFATES